MVGGIGCPNILCDVDHNTKYLRGVDSLAILNIEHILGTGTSENVFDGAYCYLTPIKGAHDFSRGEDFK